MFAVDTHSSAAMRQLSLPATRQTPSSTVLAWWSLVGLLVTTFAFLGVNIFLSGLHSYGTL